MVSPFLDFRRCLDWNIVMQCDVMCDDGGGVRQQRILVQKLPCYCWGNIVHYYASVAWLGTMMFERGSSRLVTFSLSTVERLYELELATYNKTRVSYCALDIP
jgi:hypothetical protein